MPVAVTAIALAVGGCSGTDEDSEPTVEAAASVDATPTPHQTASTEPSPEPSSSPAPTLRPVPPEAMELSEAGALAFLEWWVDMYNYVEATGETDLVFQHSEPGCTFCQNFVDRVAPVYESGGRIERDPATTFEGIVPDDLGVNGFFVADAIVNAGAASTYNRNGTIVRTTQPTNSLAIVLGIQWDNGEWFLSNVGSEDVGS
jgi:hypothetical protein